MLADQPIYTWPATRPVGATQWRALWGCLLAFSLGFTGNFTPAQAPPVRDARLTDDLMTAPGPGYAIVLHAGSTVRLSIPAEWHVMELGVGRQVRVLLSPEEIDSADSFSHGLWLSLDYLPNGLQEESADQLSNRVESELREVLGELRHTRRARLLRVGDHMATCLEFETEAPAEVQNAGGQLRGMQGIIQTSWCRLHIHLVSSSRDFEARFTEFERVLKDLQLVRPASKRRQSVAHARDAASILGSWKSSSGRFRLHGDGTVAVVPDRPFWYTATGSQKQYRGRVLYGRFRAERDLLFIVWADESKLNYRWRLAGDQLLLTDHEGRIAQLARIIE